MELAFCLCGSASSVFILWGAFPTFLQLIQRCGKAFSACDVRWNAFEKLFVYPSERKILKVLPRSAGVIGGPEMSDAKDIFEVGAMILLGIFVLSVGVPLLLAAAGVALGFLFHLAVIVIKVAVLLAIGYLVLVGIRALLR